MKTLNEYHRRFIKVVDERGKEKNYSIKRFIPMQSYDDNRFLSVHDVEILLDTTRNHYFSIDSFNKGTSWVKSFTILESRDQRLKSGYPIAQYKLRQMKPEHHRQTEAIVKKLIKLKH